MTMITAEAKYKKEAGVLTISGDKLSWVPSSRSGGVIEEELAFIGALFSSPAASGKHNIKVNFIEPSTQPPLLFTFTNPTTAAADAAEFKNQLGRIVSINKAAASAKDSSAASSAPESVGGGGSGSGGGVSGGASASRGSAAPLGNEIWTDRKLCRAVLIKHPHLAALHYELVQKGTMPDRDFWEGRENLLLSEMASSSQATGRSSQLIDDRWSSKDAKGKSKDTSGSGGGQITLTDGIIRDLFDEFPEVKEAYEENVPGKLEPAAFWTRYFNSKLWEQHRASARSSKQSSAKADPIFDRFLRDPDDDLAPRHEVSSVVNRFLDLAATEEDHNETGNAADVTMQAGKQRASLPLMRRFNEHSEKLLKASQDGEEDWPNKRPRVESTQSRDEMRRAELDLEDLHAAEASKEVPLDLAMQDRLKYFEGRAASDQGGSRAAQRSEADTVAILQQSRDSFRDWKPQLEQLRLEKRAADDVAQTLTASVRALSSSRTHNTNLPPAVLQKTLSLHTATNEYLRQFWSAALPPAPNVQVLSALSKEDREAKVEKMVGYLRGTGDKVRALIELAGREGADVDKVNVALGHTVESVEKAMVFYRSRKK